MKQFVFEATPREAFGSRAARRYRKQGFLPANLYGHGEANVVVNLDAKEFSRFLNDGHRMLTIRVGGKDERSVVREVQYDSFGSRILHIDCQRVSAHEKIEVGVPIETVGIAKGTASGGVLEQPLKDLLVRGSADSIPEHIEVNVESLEIGHEIRVRDLRLPGGCEAVQPADALVFHVLAPRGEEEVEGAEPGPTQPELIGRKKEEPEDAGE